MKKIVLTLLISLFTIGAIAQRMNPEERQRIETMKIAFFTKKLDLTTVESQKFWPLYNKYWDEKRLLGHRARDIFKKLNEGGTGGELQQYLDLQQAEYNNTKKWAEQFGTILPQEKVVKIFWAEESFKHYLLTQMKR